MGLTNYGFFTRYRQQTQQALAFLPCAPGCQGSRNDPRYCTCACQGINHGCLVYNRPLQPVPVPYGYNPRLTIQQFPELEDLSNRPVPETKPKIETERLIFPVARGTGRVAKKLGKLFAKSIGHVSENELNENIMKGLRAQFRSENVDTAIDQAFQVFYERMGSDSNRPELYELFENGDIDRALEHFGKRWVVGRPKRR